MTTRDLILLLALALAVTLLAVLDHVDGAAAVAFLSLLAGVVLPSPFTRREAP